ncbi:MAG: DNA primase, partial [Alistipes sp.]|nr:DNA primase [Alistipes sp.]
MIDSHTVDRIYAAADIVDIISDYVTLKKKGVNYQACCPFHNEKTPSFVVSPSKGVYKCFGCGKGGNAVTFVMEHEGVSYPEALKIVAKRYGIEIQEREQTEEDVRRNNDRESMFALNGWAAEYFAKYMLSSTEGRSVGLSYFAQKRGFTEATIRKFGLGFCSSEGNAMTMAALSAGYKQEFLTSTGLSLVREGDGKLRDRFRDRVIFPVHNISGRVVAFGGRTLRTDKSVAKYQNSPESEIYSKKRELYGLYFAKKAIQQQDYAIMVEGYTDVISMHQAGVENVVASSGTSLTTEQIQLLHRFTRNITVIYDGDSAGIHASLRGIDMILKEGMNVRVVLLPPEHDPDSFARAHTADQVREYIRENEEDFLTFKAKLMLADAGKDPIKRSAVISDMVQSIVQIPDSIQRSVYIKDCARIMDVDENVLVSEVARKRVQQAGGGREASDFMRRQQSQIQQERKVEVEITKPTVAGSSVEALEYELVKYLLKSGHLNYEIMEGKNVVGVNIADEIFYNLDEDKISFLNPVYQKILDTYREQWKQLGVGVKVPERHFINHIDPDVCNM